MILTFDQLAKICPTNKNINTLIQVLNLILPEFDITDVLQVSAFLSQCGHESSDFNVLTENLNYSSESLLRVWPNHFNTANISKYANNPEAIANCAYANRMGNGSESSGDGWTYRGRGAIQVTGKYSYTKYAQYKNMNIADVVNYASTLEGAVDISAWFWKSNNLNTIAEQDNVTNVTKIINSGLIGLSDRQSRYVNAKTVLTSY